MLSLASAPPGALALVPFRLAVPGVVEDVEKGTRLVGASLLAKVSHMAAALAQAKLRVCPKAWGWCWVKAWPNTSSFCWVMAWHRSCKIRLSLHALSLLSSWLWWKHSLRQSTWLLRRWWRKDTWKTLHLAPGRHRPRCLQSWRPALLC